MFDWDDLRAFLAVADSGSTLAAGRALRVSQTTAARRVAALEAALGLTLFERRQAGYSLTPDGEALVAAARGVDSAAAAFADAAASLSREAHGTVRLTTLEIYSATILPPILRELHEAHPQILIELDTVEEPRDLGAGAADIALRNSVSPTGGGLVGRRIAPDTWTLYCSRGYAARHPQPHTREDLRTHPFIGGGGEGLWRRYRAWLRRLGLEEAVAMQHDTATGMLASVRAGFGIAVLPSFFAERDPELVRCVEPMAGDLTALWLLTHERLRQVPRVRVVMDFLAERLTRMARETAPERPYPWAA
ncbi:MAG: LysR family transcriptional regulator [Alphaproteobacteria bacterium]|nr:LysR family transcriptional regulator [Alphaproteobacteria bacterium]MBV9371690.1 LysR family transcriptional regulator [Alphaproteobacteria bacterium]MBV9902466.1 LysR family transcriptional regulator [Alphaproteobacteria bacterium]